MALTISNLTYSKNNNKNIRSGSIAFDSSYPTGGESITAAELGLAYFDTIEVEPKSGYIFEPVIAAGGATAVIKVTSGAAATSGATSGGTPAGNVALNLATPAFSGTGLTAAGQVMTTTDNQTMTLNQCAGMWLIPATGATPPMLILSNTAVTGAPAVLTVQGSAATDAGAYKIVQGALTASALSTHTHSVAAAAGAEVSNGTNLSSLTGVQFTAYGS